MNLEQLFLADGRLRSIWRFFLSIILLFVVYMAAGVVVGTAFRAWHYRPPTMVALFLVSLVLLPGILAAFKLLTAVFDQRPLGSVGLAFHHGWVRELLHGVAVGAVMIITTVALERSGGFVRFCPRSFPRCPAHRGLLFRSVYDGGDQ